MYLKVPNRRADPNKREECLGKKCQNFKRAFSFITVFFFRNCDRLGWNK